MLINAIDDPQHNAVRYINVKFENNYVQAILDSGAASTLISNILIQKFQISGKLTKETRKWENFIFLKINLKNFSNKKKLKLKLFIYYKFYQF